MFTEVVLDVLTTTSFIVVFLSIIPIHLSLYIGQLIMPIIGLPLWIRAIKVPKSLWPAIKLLVPSIGSITQRNSESTFWESNSSPSIPWLGYFLFIKSLIFNSTSLSAKVTGLLSSLLSIFKEVLKYTNKHYHQRF